MTRINCIPVEELCDKHLIAEYRELPRIFKLVRASLEKGTYDEKKIPPHYVLGAGHVTFFYNKLTYVTKRYMELWVEMKRRGFKPSYHPSSLGVSTHAPTHLSKNVWNDWTPTLNAQNLNRARIASRMEHMK